MTTTVNVQFGPLGQAIEDVLACHRALVREREALTGFLARLTWVGTASETWSQVQRDWDNAYDDVVGILYDLFVALETAQGNYTGTEKALQHLWSGR